MNDLPLELLHHILSFVMDGCETLSDFRNVLLVHKRWASVLWREREGVTKSTSVPFDEVCEEAVDKGNKNIIRWAIAEGEKLEPYLFHIAAQSGNIGMIEWLMDLGCPMDAQAMIGAIRGDHFDTLKWLDTNGFPTSKYVLDEMACFGNKTMLSWAIIDQEWPLDAVACAGAARGGHLEILKWLRSLGCPWDGFTTRAAALGGHKEVYDWVVEHGCESWSNDAAHAAMMGHFDMAKWLVERHECDAQECLISAAKHGELDIFEWALSQDDITYQPRIFAMAIESGNRELMDFLYRGGYGWDESACGVAAKTGRLDILVWLRKNGCPWDEWTCVNAAKWDHRVVLQWALENGCPYHPVVHACACESVKRWLVGKGYSHWDEDAIGRFKMWGTFISPRYDTFISPRYDDRPTGDWYTDLMRDDCPDLITRIKMK